MSFLDSLESKSKKFDNPFLHWEMDKPLTEDQIYEIVKADIANPVEHDLNYDGTRAKLMALVFVKVYSPVLLKVYEKKKGVSLNTL